jgi:hypothetical protein
MIDFEKRLRDLEDDLTNTTTGELLKKFQMPNDDVDSAEKGKGFCLPYVGIIAVLIPLITAAVLYFAKPKWVTKKAKGKQVICMKSLLIWTTIITVIGWTGLFLVNYCGAFNGAAVCFGK